ncbi:MAG TPA: NmrA family NAD(P)-binding protein [Intrasporangiaceae bacterium]|nr:NmrA family NAD(P)-binding protein [Intrasporangiaceae bacterium]
MRVLVLGTSGKTGRALTRALVRRGARVRALVRPGSPHEEVCRAAGADQVAGGDLESGAGLDVACAGVEAVYHLAPNVHPDEVGMARRVVEAASAAGITRFGFHSVLHPDDATMPHHVRKHLAEQVIREVMPTAVVLRPAAYLENLLPMVRAGELVVPYSLDVPFTNVALDDVAEVAARVLTEAGHAGGIYELVGPETLTTRHLAEQAGVPARQISIAEWDAGPGATLSDQTRADLVAMFASYDAAGFTGDSADLGRLLGRPPTRWSDLLRRR